MPYIKQSDREAINFDVRAVLTAGDLNYVITKFILQLFALNPRYETIHELRLNFVTDPKSNEYLNELRRVISDRFTVADIYAAAAEAYYEFRFRVGAAYEEKKRQQNGDLQEYKDVLKQILETEHEHVTDSGDQRKEAIGENNLSSVAGKSA